MLQPAPVVFLRGKKVILRPPRKEDAPTYQRWVCDPEVRQFILAFRPMSIRAEEEWIDGLDKRNNDIVLAIDTLEGQHIGNMALHEISWKDRVATTGAILGEKEFWGKGYGTDAKMILLDYAFNTLNLRKIKSAVYAFNKRSLQYSLHCGYKIEGRRRQEMFKNGRYHDIIDLGLFKKEWLPIWRLYSETGKVR